MPQHEDKQEMSQGIYRVIREVSLNPDIGTVYSVSSFNYNSHIEILDSSCSKYHHRKIELPFVCQVVKESDKLLTLRIGDYLKDIELLIDNEVLDDIAFYEEMVDKGAKLAGFLQKPRLLGEKEPFNSEKYHSTLASAMYTASIPLNNNEQKSLTFDVLLGIIRDVASTLELMGTEGNVYLDINPHHIFIKVNEDGKVEGFLGDFDFSYFYKDMRFEFRHAFYNLYELARILSLMIAPTLAENETLDLNVISVGLLKKAFAQHEEFKSWRKISTIEDVYSFIQSQPNSDLIQDLNKQLKIAKAIYQFTKSMEAVYSDIQNFLKKEENKKLLESPEGRNALHFKIDTQFPQSCKAIYFLKCLREVGTIAGDIPLPIFKSSMTSEIISENRGTKRKRESEG